MFPAENEENHKNLCLPQGCGGAPPLAPALAPEARSLREWLGSAKGARSLNTLESGSV